MMKGLSLTAPYGSLIAVAAARPDLGKSIETRTGRALYWRYRGSLAIHQALNLAPVGGPEGLAELCAEEPFRTALRSLYGAAFVAEELPRGKIVAVVDLYDIAEITPSGLIAHGTRRPLPPEPERSFGDYAPGRSALMQRNIRALPKPVVCRGAQGLWDVPAEVQAQVAAQLQ